MYPPAVLIGALVVTAVASALQGTVGFGFAVISVPILALLYPGLTPIPQILLAGPLTFSMALRERRQLDLSGAGWIVAGRLPGAAIGALLLATVTRQALDGVIAIVVLAAVVALAAGLTVRLTPLNKFAAGVVSGITGTTSAIGGPPLALIYRNEEGGTLRSSLGAIFTIGVIINVTTLTIVGQIHRQDIVTALLLAPAVAVGLFVSRYLKGRVEGATLRRGILVVSALAAIGLAVRTLFSP
ncbi:sulfite exporter TauE/SafE [bacterium BMS3Abin02]|nr:sulfite exporter TauE/SafE [bacterium BMS3Abin02]GBE20821.1 sulfite exporter TauE/SafE [bacterium BMS3Bbin01]HDL49421.1 sulfite exporter TauE/SafE family protein [Actinomycetota bacterium]